MGVYDTLIDGDRSVQVKCWDSKLELYYKGDKVPPIADMDTYTIILPSYCCVRFALIVKGTFKGLTNEVKNTWEPYITKWGGQTDLTIDQDEQSPIAKALKALVASFENQGDNK